MVTNNAINLKTAGLASYDGSDVFAGRTITPPAASISITNGDGIAGNPTLALANDLAAVEGLSTTGLATRTATSTWTTRTITAGSGVSVADGDGVAGNPTISAGASVPTTFTEDSGSATPSANNINILGTSAQGIVTSGAGATVTITASSATTSQKGVVALATNAEAIAGTDTAKAITADDLKAKLGVQTIHGVMVAEGTTGALTAITGTNGQVIIAATAADPGFATLSSSDSSISFTTGANTLSLQVAGGATTGKTITGDSGGALSPTAGNWNILGTTAQGITSSGSGSTLTFTVANATTSQKGVVALATNAEAIAGTDTGKAVTSDDLKAKLGTQTIHGVLVGNSTTGAVTALTAGSNGQVLVGSTAADPVMATLGSTDGSISYTTGAGTLSIQGTAATTTQRGSVILATNAETIAGTDTAKVTTPDDIKAKLGTQTNHALPIDAGSSSAFTWTGAPTNGQLLIGSTGADPGLGSLSQPAAGLTITGGAGTITFALANDLAAVEGISTTGLATRTATDTWTTRTITAGAGISISNGDGVSGNPTIAAIGSGFAWNDQSGTFTAAVNNGYFLTAASTPTLPASPSQGDSVAFQSDAAATMTITANTGQKIRIGAALSGAAGTAVSTIRGDSIELVYRASGTTWFAVGAPQGTWNVT